MKIYNDGSPGQLSIHIQTSHGTFELRLKRIVDHGEYFVQADLWQGMEHMGNQITRTSACVRMRWNGIEYKFIQPGFGQGYRNAHWQEMEKLISNTIMINE